jgi:hypothetical protein
LEQNEKIGKKKERKEKKFRQPCYNLLTAFQSNMFNPRRKRKIGEEDTMALGGRWAHAKAHSFQRKAPKGSLQIIRPPRCRILHLRCDPHGTEKSLDLVPDIPQFE